MSRHFDDLETRSSDERANDLAEALPWQIAEAQAKAPALAAHLAGVEAATITSVEALATLPVIRKSALGAAQAGQPPFGGYTTLPPHADGACVPVARSDLRTGRTGDDWWRMGRFLAALGHRAGRYRAELLFLSHDAGGHDVRERRAGGRGDGVSGRHRADRTAGAGRA